MNGVQRAAESGPFVSGPHHASRALCVHRGRYHPHLEVRLRLPECRLHRVPAAIPVGHDQRHGPGRDTGDVATGEEVARGEGRPRPHRHLWRQSDANQDNGGAAGETPTPPALEHHPIGDDGDHGRQAELREEREPGGEEVRQHRNIDQQTSREWKQVMGHAVDMEKRAEAPHQGGGRSAAHDDHPAVPAPSQEGPQAEKEQGYADVRVGLELSGGPMADQTDGERRVQAGEPVGYDEVDSIGHVLVRRLDQPGNPPRPEKLIGEGDPGDHHEQQHGHPERLGQGNDALPHAPREQQGGDHDGGTHHDQAEGQDLLTEKYLRGGQQADDGAPAEVAVVGVPDHCLGGDE